MAATAPRMAQTSRRPRFLPLAASSLSALLVLRSSCGWVPPSMPRAARLEQGKTLIARPSVAVEAAPTFDLQGYLVQRKKVVEEALDASLESTTPFTAKIVESMRYSLLAGGKRIRPIMTLAGYEMVAGGENAAEEAVRVAMPTALATEMIHTMSLIHDDLPAMDNDDLRRGKPTNHVKYGEDIAILAGDALLSESFAHVARTTPKSVPAERVVEVIRRLGDSVGAVGLAGGQVMDLECEAKHEASLDELRWIHEHKTAALLEVAVVSGAVLAGATEAEIAACQKYSRMIGLAFQVADDILDVTQTSEQLGKTAGKDEATDKTTYVKLLGLDGAREEAARLKAEAIGALAPFGDRAAPLVAIAEYIVNREN